MPQVIQGLDLNLDRFEFLLDRHFWITGFMSDGPPLPCARSQHISDRRAGLC